MQHSCTFYQPGEVRHKAGRFPAEVPLKPATRGQNGWAVLCRPAGSAPASSTAAPEPADFLDHFDARKAFSLRAGDPGAGARAGDAGQAASTETTRGHRQRRWPSPCKGYGKGPAVNGELAFVLVNKGADRLAPRFSSGAVQKRTSLALCREATWRWRSAWDGAESRRRCGASCRRWRSRFKTSTLP